MIKCEICGKVLSLASWNFNNTGEHRKTKDGKWVCSESHLIEYNKAILRSGGFSNQRVDSGNSVKEQPKTAEQILAESESERIKHQIEIERREEVRKSNKEFFEGIGKVFIFLFKNWKITLSIIVVCFIVFIGLETYNDWRNGKRNEIVKNEIREMEKQIPTTQNSEVSQKEINKYDSISDNKTEVISEVNTITLYQVNDPDGYSNLRDKPNGDIIRKVLNTEKFEVIDSLDGYKKVKFSDGSTGYIHGSRIKHIE